MQRTPGLVQIGMMAVIVVAVLAAGCGGPRQQAAAQPPPTATPGGPPTPFPQYLANTDADAIRLATDLERNPGQAYYSWGGGTLANITSVQWIRSTIWGVHSWFAQYNPAPASAVYPATTWDTPVWVFRFTGDIREVSKTNPTGGPGYLHTLYMVLSPDRPGPYVTVAGPTDLSVFAVPSGAGARAPLTPVHTILPGEAPLVDALRAPPATATSTATPVASTPVPAASATP